MHRDRTGAAARPRRAVRTLAAIAVGALAAIVAPPPPAAAIDAADFFREDARRARANAAPSRGLFESLFAPPPPAAVAPAPVPLQAAPSAPTASSSHMPGRRTMCVRLCDGYAFPIGALTSRRDLPLHDLSCNAGCPGAPTKVFVLEAGEEDLGAARSADGAFYRDLPVAFAFRRAVDSGCSCQGPNQRVAARLDAREDMTLRRGDIVVTKDGPLVFQGRDGRPQDLADFAPLGEARMAARTRALADATLGISHRRELLQAFEADQASLNLATR